jgi:hypothetical protein
MPVTGRATSEARAHWQVLRVQARPALHGVPPDVQHACPAAPHIPHTGPPPPASAPSSASGTKQPSPGAHGSSPLSQHAWPEAPHAAQTSPAPTPTQPSPSAQRAHGSCVEQQGWPLPPHAPQSGVPAASKHP